ncbi:hypothetical protein GALMADRAFT_246852 [Galerina marginata CBS 339.88]|uniref:Required for respiratory growth protein 7, mitochondrial n=1 Tax=Galerina marginata (strain CBS 339.88) TaxID=685588 RepID=A0A067T049_GALM3|nr:hypothetical protein GALMADRAFT_246852 [Galerina marginata CBS 339.88]
MQPSFQHCKIPSFSRSQFLLQRRPISSSRQAYAPRLTTVQKGSAFEERSLKLLAQTMSMSLKRVGGKEDGGIDLVGWWWLPHVTVDAQKPSLLSFERRRLRVIGQCKAEKKKLGPNYVRELEGVMYRFLTLSSTNASIYPDTENDLEPLPTDALEHSRFPMVALLISESPFTKSTLLRAQSSPIPFFLLHLPPLEELSSEDSHANDDIDGSLGDVGAAMCNPALCGAQGLLKGRLEVRWERHHLGQQGRPAIWWNNNRLPSEIPDLELPGVGERMLADGRGKSS